MTAIVIDRVGAIVLQNGILRVDCIISGPNGEERPSGTLIIPANQVPAVLQSLVGATRDSTGACANRRRSQLPPNRRACESLGFELGSPLPENFNCNRPFISFQGCRAPARRCCRRSCGRTRDFAPA